MKESAGFNISDGLSQFERFTSFLDPGYFQIDERTTEDFLDYTIRLSALFNYYNFNNEPDGSWEDFFNSDIDVLATLISKSRLKKVIRKFDAIISKLESAEEQDEALPVINEAFTLLYNMVSLLLKYRSKLSLAYNRNSQTVSMISIVDSLDEEFGNFISGYSQAVSQFKDIVKLDISKLEENTIKSLQNKDEKGLFDYEGDIKKVIKFARIWFDNLFSRLRLKFSNLISAATYYLEHQQWQGDVYDPHLGLFITFLHLYKYLQGKINGLTGKHLHYYYHDILGMQYKAAVPDTVHIVFQAVPLKKKVVLKAGECLLGEIPGSKETVQYKLQQDAIITQAQIAELKTGFISKLKQFLPGDGNYEQVRESRLYIADHNIVKPAKFASEKNNLNAWALLGEEQSKLSETERTMKEADMGLIFASPLLYAKDGKRLFEIKFYLTQASFRQFQEYVTNFSLATDPDKALVVHNMLNKSFLIKITGENGWISVKKTSIRLSSDPNEKYLELNFMLSPIDESVATYDSERHGGNYKFKAPAVELIMNNSLFHHPFSFYKNFLLERISITTRVANSNQLQLQNSFGPVSTSAPFQLFGPVPTVGSYLDIKNTNIFNKYTKNCSISFDWFDLPKDSGGFEGYFNGYDNGVKNESFKVTISALANNKPVTESNRRQTYNLFETFRNDTSELLLKNETAFNNININQLGLKNEMSLNEDTNLTASNGSLRIEFASPKDGFGHRLYPLILPGIIGQNSKKYRQKHLVPNTPYIPVVKSVLVDYVLEHTEVLKAGKRNEEDANIHLIHLYPFGYDAVYPDKENTDIYLVPPIAEERNLLIGLEQVEPEQELSLLFQLQEMSFHHTAHSVEPVNWTYLHNNNWTPLPTINILNDTTNHFVNSGIVQFHLPNDFTNGNTILNPDLFWIKASSTGHNAESRVVAILTQACLAVHDVKADSKTSVSYILPPGSVKGFAKKQPDIVNLWQFFPSANGRKEETKDQYYLWVSERLRHKGRPITALDISQMILDAFPDILMVKCFGRGVPEGLILPGINVQIIVIPREKERGGFISEEPRVSLAALLKIKEFINSKLSSFATAEVGNPVYEKIKIVCSVSIKENRLSSNAGYYVNLLNDDIKKYLTPWLYNDDEELRIGGKVYVSDILDFIKKRPYISYVSGFSVLYFYRRYNIQKGEFESIVVDTSVSPSDYLETSRPDAIFISSSRHIIRILGSQKYTEPVKSGIGDLVIGNELPIYGAFDHKTKAVDNVDPIDNENNLEFNFNF